MQFVPTLFTIAWLGLFLMARKFDSVTLILCSLFLVAQFYLVSNDRKTPTPGGEDTRLNVIVGAAILADVKLTLKHGGELSRCWRRLSLLPAIGNF